MARNGAIKARTAAANQLHSLCDTAPDIIRSQLRGLSLAKKVAVAERWRLTSALTPESATKRALVSVARRWRTLDHEIRPLDAHIKAILETVAAPLLAVYGVGYDTAAQLLITAGDNPERLHRERSFAALCGATPIKASSGKTKRHRLNLGGDRHANSALWSLVITHTVAHQRTGDYVERRTTDSNSVRPFSGSDRVSGPLSTTYAISEGNARILTAVMWVAPVGAPASVTRRGRPR